MILGMLVQEFVKENVPPPPVRNVPKENNIDVPGGLVEHGDKSMVDLDDDEEPSDGEESPTVVGIDVDDDDTESDDD